MRQKYTYTISIAVVLFLFSFLIPISFANGAEQTESLPSISGETGILIDASTGKVLYEKNAYTRMEPASTTKIMTAILALEKGNLSDVVTTGKQPTLADGTRIYLEEGEQLTLEQMLYGMMLNSGNDAAIAIAEHIGGSVEAFVEMMNEKAREIGAKDTTFVNPNGLPAKGHLTTAYDLALISRYALLNLPEFRKIVSTKNAEIPWQAQDSDRQLINLNKLLWNYEGADGVKTGYTSTAGSTLVASATRNGWQLISVILKSDAINVWHDSAALLDYGFTNFERKNILSENTLITEEKVKYGDSIGLLANTSFITVLPKNGPDVTQKVVINPDIKAPVIKGEILGQVIFYQGNEKLGSVDLIAANDVKRKIYTYWWFWIVSLLLIIYTPFRIMVGIRRYKRNKRRVHYVSSYVKRYR
ncbi:Serine-type D-Ala-D-Ala carboxypeptidase [Tepidanaerobacter acetatoxydans Re1]|uniref:serine-type D-Ala-D-Ala carboxypeptidase n=1 Tax=Tepidanaerobacter acetatoxydans (strain DSM 21804 / JCM 16047 / Re1) TaxID=1209989 RepID=F4LRQ0_TEPAE|nr:D-alanyl-D-alanine carboxypeptidase family protein [Tepidanaerobacter acetatoxydans]AEE91118.1 Serine-type D-Ala-D-Ala carboxypeptidase [Tepidanaerobacter acetatoxydans Re1]CDI40562.1 Serine-type D-Ala-D-Ala carboxypeptidase [Tepidanaerobacter acetatoxydans Re1]